MHTITLQELRQSSETGGVVIAMQAAGYMVYQGGRQINHEPIPDRGLADHVADQTAMANSSAIVDYTAQPVTEF